MAIDNETNIACESENTSDHMAQKQVDLLNAVSSANEKYRQKQSGIKFVNQWKITDCPRLHYLIAAGCGPNKIRRHLLKYPDQATAISDKGLTAIHIWVMKYGLRQKDDRSDADIVLILEELVNNGADVNAPSSEGTTPLLMFKYSRNVNYSAFYALLAAGADVNIQNKKGYTIAHLHYHCADARLLDAVIKNKDIYNRFDINTPMSNGDTMLTLFAKNPEHPLYGCCDDWNPFVVIRGVRRRFDYLINNGADINREDDNGDTFLHILIRIHGRKYYNSLVKHAIDLGAKMDIPNNKGETPQSIFKAKNSIPTRIRAFFK